MAQKSDTGNYVKLAYLLALSLKLTQQKISDLSIAVTSKKDVPKEWQWAFDQIIEIPWSDNAKNDVWKLANEWKAIHLSPYDQTIKLDADVLFTSDIGSWWSYLDYLEPDVLICDSVKTYRGEDADTSFYRQVFLENNIPNAFSNMTFFNKSKDAYDFFDLIREIFLDWYHFGFEHIEKIPQKIPTTDVAYGLAAKLIQKEDYFFQTGNPLTFVHMKNLAQGWEGVTRDGDWRQSVPYTFTPELKLFVGNFEQKYPFHYVMKDFATEELIEKYEAYINRTL